MAGSRSTQPTNWAEYGSGRSPMQDSTDSLGSHVQFEAAITSPALGNQVGVPARNDIGEHGGGSLRHRTSRSSISSRINTLAHVGGPNSFENFARSWSRAAVFNDLPQHRPSVVLSGDEEVSVGSKLSGSYPSTAQSRSLLTQHLNNQGISPENATDERQSTQKEDEESQLSVSIVPSPGHGGSSFLDPTPQSSSPFGSNLGGVYGSLHSRRGDSGLRPSILREGVTVEERKRPTSEQEPLLLKVIEQDDGKPVYVVVGQSTLPQTVFNSVNTLIGIGLLSLPLALKQSGWLIGMLFLVLAALTTRYTAHVLAKCLDLDHSLVTFSDIAWKAFGLKVRIVVGLLFSIELLAACFALVVLFADSLDALIPGYGVTEWKILAGIVLIPLNIVPLRLLSVTSVLGILSCLGIVVLTLIDGIIKRHAPGSIREPASVTLFPPRWSDLPLSFGLLMAPWGGHGVFPNIYRDMRHPAKYAKAVDYTYVLTYSIDMVIAIAGYVMFGQTVRDEVTSNLLLSRGYPHAISVCIVVFIAIIPLTKVPLNVRPIFVLIEDLVGLNTNRPSASPLIGSSKLARSALSALVRGLTLALIVLLAIVIPSFDVVMGFMGAALAFSICIIFPAAFHLKLFRKELDMLEVVFNWILIGVCSILAVISTVWVFLPKHIRHSLDGTM